MCWSEYLSLLWVTIQETLPLGIYYIPINDTYFELSVFWPSDTESGINELRFSESVLLSFTMRLTLVTCFTATLCKVRSAKGLSLQYEYRKKGFRHLFTFTIKYLTNTDVPAWLAHFLHSALIFELERPKGHYLEVVVHLVLYTMCTEGVNFSSDSSPL